MKEIIYLEGDATNPVIKDTEETNVICHCCNTLGAWGKGFVVPLGRKYPQAKKAYYSYLRCVGKDDSLGRCCLVSGGEKLMIANIFGQERIYPTKDGQIPLDYEALKRGFESCKWMMGALGNPFSIHMPRIGCGLAGGNWDVVEGIINGVFGMDDIQVYVYDFTK